MKMIHRLLLLAALTLPFLGACKKEEAAGTGAPQAASVARPADPNNDAAWNAYLTDVVKHHLDGAMSVFAYTLPSADSKDFQGNYERQLDKAREDVNRGGVDGTLLAFGSPDSGKSADLAIASFAKAAPGSMKGVRVLFIGSAADKDRVQAAIAPSGAKFEFVESK